MQCCGFTCCGAYKHVIYLIGKKEHKDLFLKNVLNIDASSDTFQEQEIKDFGVPLVIQTCELSPRLREIRSLHTKMACGVVYVSSEDVSVDFSSFTLFVLMNKQTRQKNDSNMIVSSVIENNWEECKEGFKKLVETIKSH